MITNELIIVLQRKMFWNIQTTIIDFLNCNFWIQVRLIVLVSPFLHSTECMSDGNQGLRSNDQAQDFSLVASFFLHQHSISLSRRFPFDKKPFFDKRRWIGFSHLSSILGIFFLENFVWTDTPFAVSVAVASSSLILGQVTHGESSEWLQLLSLRHLVIHRPCDRHPIGQTATQNGPTHSTATAWSGSAGLSPQSSQFFLIDSGGDFLFVSLKLIGSPLK